jgi:hypothetical protein
MGKRVGGRAGGRHCGIGVAGEASERHSEIRKFREWPTKSLKLDPLVAKLSGLKPPGQCHFCRFVVLGDVDGSLSGPAIWHIISDDLYGRFVLRLAQHNKRYRRRSS